MLSRAGTGQAPAAPPVLSVVEKPNGSDSTHGPEQSRRLRRRGGKRKRTTLVWGFNGVLHCVVPVALLLQVLPVETNRIRRRSPYLNEDFYPNDSGPGLYMRR